MKTGSSGAWFGQDSCNERYQNMEYSAVFQKR